MAKKWSLIKDGIIAKTITNGIVGGKRNLINGRSSANHTDEWLLSNGWLPHIEPIILWFQVKGEPVVNIDHIGYVVTTKSEAEIDSILEAEIEQIANNKVAEIASPPEKVDRMLARGIQLERKERKSGLDAAEAIEADLLDAVNLDCYSVRKAANDIKIETNALTLGEKTNLPGAWADDHSGWPA